jgi:GT2 family glycosyltransferase
MLEHAQRKEVGAVGAKLIYSNNTIQHAGIIIGIVGNPPVGGHSHKYFPKNDNGYFGRIQHICNVSAVTAACIMMRKEVFEEVGGFDEKNLSVAFNDVDLCLKIREKGYLIIYTPYAELYHHESLSRGYEDTPGKQRRFLDEVKYMREKWGKIMDAGDPYYNKNLTLEKEDFSIRI